MSLLRSPAQVLRPSKPGTLANGLPRKTLVRAVSTRHPEATGTSQRPVEQDRCSNSNTPLITPRDQAMDALLAVLHDDERKQALGLDIPVEQQMILPEDKQWGSFIDESREQLDACEKEITNRLERFAEAIADEEQTDSTRASPNVHQQTVVPPAKFGPGCDDLAQDLKMRYARFVDKLNLYRQQTASWGTARPDTAQSTASTVTGVENCRVMRAVREGYARPDTRERARRARPAIRQPDRFAFAEEIDMNCASDDDDLADVELDNDDMLEPPQSQLPMPSPHGCSPSLRADLNEYRRQRQLLNGGRPAFASIYLTSADLSTAANQ